MIENKKKYLPLLNILKRLKPKDVSDIMEFLTDDAIDNICECVYNVIHTDINLPSRKKAKLRNFIKSNCSIHRINKITSKKRRYLKEEKH
jgi:putative N-acetylmannosamine-6-phosphate epimerase